MSNNYTTILNKVEIEERFIFSKQFNNLCVINDGDGQELKFCRNERGNHVVFTKDTEGVDVAVEHCADGNKIFHLKEDSKGLPAMHEFRQDGSEHMYLLDTDSKLEKTIEKKTNGDKISTWYGPNDEVISEEQRQTGGIVFKMMNEYGEAIIWLKADGTVTSNGAEDLVNHLRKVFNNHLDGVEV